MRRTISIKMNQALASFVMLLLLVLTAKVSGAEAVAASPVLSRGSVPALQQVFWRGGFGYTRTVPFNPQYVPQWSGVSPWEVKSIAALPGSGAMQAWESYAQPSGLLERYWRGNQRYARVVPWSADGSPNYVTNPAFAPSPEAALPGSGAIETADLVARPAGGALTQALWRGGQGWVRDVPIDPGTGEPNWSAAPVNWTGPLVPDALPGSGRLQTQSSVTYPAGLNLLQALWRNNKGYSRTVPIDASGAPVWREASRWSDPPLDIASLPGSGDIEAQNEVMYYTARKTFVLVFDPSVPQADGSFRRLSQHMGWKSPTALAAQYRDWIFNTSSGRVAYQIIGTRVVNDIPVKKDGFDYTVPAYLECVRNPVGCHNPDEADYRRVVSDYGLCDKLNARQIDEVWMFGGPYFGFYESRLTGPNTFRYNSPPLVGTSCGKLLPIMGFSYERGLDEMVHNLMHRVEATMTRVYRTWEQNRTSHNWDKFGLVASQSPSIGRSGCGSAHFPPNAILPYSYESSSFVSSFCDDFLGYPGVSPGSNLRSINCSEWGCTALGYYGWWMRHLPAAAGRMGDGRFTDWWLYVSDPDTVFLTEPRITCSSEYAPEMCDAVDDTRYGTCNAGEWATAGTSTGWVELRWAQPRTVSSVILRDRACGERVTAGHITFSDLSAPASFGALEDTGNTATTVSFTPRTVVSLRVHIDASAGGANPGLAEVTVR
jgi:hypothetical protein